MSSIREKAIRDFVRQNFRLEGGQKLTPSHLKELGKQLEAHGKLGRGYLRNARAALGGVANPASRTQTEQFGVGLYEAAKLGEIEVNGKKLEAHQKVTKSGLRQQVSTLAGPPAPPKDDALLKRQRALRVQAIQQAMARGRQPPGDLPPGGQGPNVGPLVGGRTGGTLPLTSVSRLDRGGPQPAATEPTVAPPPESDQPYEPANAAEGAPTEAPVGSLATTADQPEDAAAVPPTADDQTLSEEPPTEEPEDLEIG